MPADTFITYAPDRRDRSWSREWTPTDAHNDPATFEGLPQSAFIWTNFQVYVTFRIGGVDAGQGMDVVPVSVLDFALMLQAARAGMKRDGTAEVTLSDRGDQWSFSRRRGLVWLRIRGRSDNGWITASCPGAVFDSLVDGALSDALRLLFREQPALRRNTYLQSLARRATTT